MWGDLWGKQAPGYKHLERLTPLPGDLLDDSQHLAQEFILFSCKVGVDEV